jgi:hypothetical protein
MTSNTPFKLGPRSWESYTREQACGARDYPEPIIKSVNKPVGSTGPVQSGPVQSDSKEDNSVQMILDLEKRGEEFVKSTNIMNKSIDTAGQMLMNHMKEGADKFKEETGREMTYAEMRAAWG